MTAVEVFLAEVTAKYNTGQATELTYRSAIEKLLGSFDSEITVINEPKHIRDVGAPDFILKRGDIPIGWLEAKDVPIGIRHLKDANEAQRQRYLKALPNLIYTNGLDFDFYRDGKLLTSVTIGDPLMGIQPRTKNFATLENLLRDFIAQKPQTITSPKDLATRMAGKAVLIKDIFSNTLREDTDFRSELAGQYQAFKEQLIHDISIEDFADIYAETIAYGMFAARLHDLTKEDFSREEAHRLLPKSNPFLRNLFSFVAGPNLDDRISWIIDDLAKVFQAVDPELLKENFARLKGRNDPFLHFYETFLAAYNPAKRKARGVWYTPEPVVNFIVRAVDDVLKIEFGLAEGLADISKVPVEWDTGQKDKKGKPITIHKDVHRVQILDPATGTGTFLAEVIKQIAPKVKGAAEGMWSQYIEQDLIPRVHGFELLMASYAMCHMKLDMVLTDLGYKPSAAPPRLSVYLTNSLEEGEPANQELPFARWLSDEVKAANTIKRDMPIMCVIGNPPYSGESANKGDWIMRLMDAYKKEPGGKEKLKERNPKWINDDYVKFIRFAEHLIEKNGEGILGFITNHGYLDNPTFRGMRWHLLKTFDKIYVLDLHGNAKKKEVSPDGTSDKNVFDIMQGVAIIIGVKKKVATKDKSLAQVFHSELWGAREGKYKTLWEVEIAKHAWIELPTLRGDHAFVPRNNDLKAQYDKGFDVQEFMPVNSVGIVTARDELTIDMDKERLWLRVEDFTKLEVEVLREKYNLGKDVQDWGIASAKKDIAEHFDVNNLVHIAYRPFDTRWTFYTGKSRGFHCRPRDQVMRNLLDNKNISISISKQQKGALGFHHCLLHRKISESSLVSNKTAEISYDFPLYKFESVDQTRRVNFEPKLYKKLQDLAADKEHGAPDEMAVFDYIYGVLHAPHYRETYKEFLKIDFPRIPWPSMPAVFWDVSEKGGQLRRLHLMEPQAVGDTPYFFKGEGNGVVEKPDLRNGQVFINKTQYFDAVPRIAWDFYIGGYQPAQKWLKDRKGRALSFEEVKHYQKIIRILAETDRIMKTFTNT